MIIMEQRNVDRREKLEKVMVCTVGDRAEEFIPLVVRKIQPRILYMICNEQQISTVVSITSTLKSIKYKLILVDDTDPREISEKVFHTLNYLLSRFTREEIFLNATAGSILLCSLAMAAACMFGIKSFYILENNGPQVNEITSPFERFGLVLMQQAVRFYSHHLYSAAQDIFSHISERAADISLALIGDSLSLLSDAYESWEKFRYLDDDGAYVLLKSLSKKLDNFKRFSEFAIIMKNRVDRNLEFLSELLGSTSGGKKISPFLILDIFLNGSRRLEEERFDEAINRFYRCIEGVIQYRLIRYHSIDPSNPSFDKVGEEETKHFLYLIGKNTLPKRLALYDSYILLLRILSDDFAMKIDEKDLKALMYSRNHSILSHGTNTLSLKVAKEFKIRTEKLLRILFKLEKRNLHEIMKDAQFLKLDEKEILKALSPI